MSSSPVLARYSPGMMKLIRTITKRLKKGQPISGWPNVNRHKDGDTVPVEASACYPTWSFRRSDVSRCVNVIVPSIHRFFSLTDPPWLSYPDLADNIPPFCEFAWPLLPGGGPPLQPWLSRISTEKRTLHICHARDIASPHTNKKHSFRSMLSSCCSPDLLTGRGAT